MIALCLYCAQPSADFCIPDFQRLAFEMCLFESADFQKYPFEFEFQTLNSNLTSFLHNLKF
jgi:hypothetical protein